MWFEYKFKVLEVAEMDYKVKAFWIKFCNEMKLSKDIKYEA